MFPLELSENQTISYQATKPIITSSYVSLQMRQYTNVMLHLTSAIKRGGKLGFLLWMAKPARVSRRKQSRLHGLRVHDDSSSRSRRAPLLTVTPTTISPSGMADAHASGHSAASWLTSPPAPLPNQGDSRLEDSPSPAVPSAFTESAKSAGWDASPLVSTVTSTTAAAGGAGAPPQ